MASNFNDLTGRVFSRWTVLRCSRRASYAGHQTQWECRCECGTLNPAVGYSALMQGASRSCGCLRRDLAARPDSVRSQNKREYGIWQGMKTRCYNEKHPSFRTYGARGITICSRWLKGFEFFIADMGSAPEGGSIERNDVNGDYEPGNCRWIPKPMQSRNRRSNYAVTWKGETCLLVDVARMENVEYMCFRQEWLYCKDLAAAVEKIRATGNLYRERAEMRKL